MLFLVCARSGLNVMHALMPSGDRRLERIPCCKCEKFSLVGIPYTSIDTNVHRMETHKSAYTRRLILIRFFLSSRFFFWLLFGVLCYALWIQAVAFIGMVYAIDLPACLVCMHLSVRVSVYVCVRANVWRIYTYNMYIETHRITNITKHSRRAYQYIEVHGLERDGYIEYQPPYIIHTIHAQCRSCLFRWFSVSLSSLLNFFLFGFFLWKCMQNTKCIAENIGSNGMKCLYGRRRTGNGK